MIVKVDLRMAKFIELSSGVNVSPDCIESVQRVDEMTCNVTTYSGSAFTSIYPAWYILMQLEKEDIEQPDVAQPPVDRVNLWGHQYFAG